jgi:hypothetical protein
MKKKSFSLPFIGYDYGSEFNVNYDVLIGEFGNPIIAIQIKNIVTQYSADRALYLKYHSILLNIISIIGEGYIVQKLDIFDKKIYQAEAHEEYLQQKYSEHFAGRIYKQSIAFWYLPTGSIKAKRKTSTNIQIKKYKELRDKAEKSLCF